MDQALILGEIQVGSGEFFIYAALVVGGIGALFGAILYVGSRVFHVEVDPRIDAIQDALPGANCGACGEGGCRAYAEAVVVGGKDASLCAPGGADCAAAIAKIMGVDASGADPKVAVVHCAGGNSLTRSRGKYNGVKDCRAATLGGVAGGAKVCSFGCLGLGTCEVSCPFDAIVMTDEGLPQIIEELCTGCSNCVTACPRSIIKLHSKKLHVHVMCNSKGKAKKVRAACDVGCIGCRKCVKVCKFEAIEVVDNLARIIDDKCKNCGKCATVCPQTTIWNLRKARKAASKAIEEAKA